MHDVRLYTNSSGYVSAAMAITKCPHSPANNTMYSLNAEEWIHKKIITWQVITITKTHTAAENSARQKRQFV